MHAKQTIASKLTLGLFASKRDPFEAFQFADRLFDAGTGFV